MRFAFIALALLATVAKTSAEKINSTEALPNEIDPSTTSRSDEWKIEGSVCHHKDYRSYVKCLLRHRRYEAPQARGRIVGGGPNCMEECERESCRRQIGGSCADVCYDRCLKKTKEIHHRITEYESTCDDGDDCDEATKSGVPPGPAPIANLTTSIDIRNYVDNTNVILTKSPIDSENRSTGDRKEPTDQGTKNNEDRNKSGNNKCANGDVGCTGTGTQDGHRNSTPPLGGPSPGFRPWYPSPSFALIPQIQMVPQLTFGLGISSSFGFGAIGGGGCAYTNIWLCLSHELQQPQVRDCSGCQRPYPYSRGGCDPSC